MRLGRVLLCGVAACFALAAAASDPPDSRHNAVTGKTETVDMAGTGGQFEIRYTTSDGVTKPVATLLTADPAHDRRPRISISPLGDTLVCWHRDKTPAATVICRSLELGAPAWSPERVMSEPTEDSRLPVVIHDGDRGWVAFEITEGNGRSIAVNNIDEPDPIVCRTVMAHTTFDGDLDVRLHLAPGRLWVTWVHSPSEIGWSVYDDDTGEWSAPHFMPYLFGAIELVIDLIEGLVLEP